MRDVGERSVAAGFRGEVVQDARVLESKVETHLLLQRPHALLEVKL